MSAGGSPLCTPSVVAEGVDLVVDSPLCSLAGWVLEGIEEFGMLPRMVPTGIVSNSSVLPESRT